MSSPGFCPVNLFDMPSQKCHPRNRHTGRYDFKKLIETCPELDHFITLSPFNELSIDFSNPQAVRTFNRALLKHFYGLVYWDIPPDFLCPPVPGRADYLHYAADLLGSANGGIIPKGPQIRVLDIGVGASCIYPIIGNREYGWSFIGSEIDPEALTSADLIIKANPGLASVIQLRKQTSTVQIFNGIVQAKEEFDLAICNPPFHKSLEEAQEGSSRKWKNLGRTSRKVPHGKKSVSAISTVSSVSPSAPLLNFGGKSSELWCPGGEVDFIGRMIRESAAFRNQIFWFTTLVSNADHLPVIYRSLKKVGVSDTRTIEMSQGQKRSRLVAWTWR